MSFQKTNQTISDLACGDGTVLARYRADQLDRECEAVRANDQFRPYVPETDQNIARVFQEAERGNAALVIDEADSFLFKEMATHTWETTQVNEFLVAFEGLPRILYLHHQPPQNMDQAVMRRFSHMVAFTYSKPEQVRALYDALLAPLASEAMPRELEAELMAMRRLTPGDFHAVRALMLNAEEKVGHADLVCALRKEQGLKLEGSTRGMGFL